MAATSTATEEERQRYLDQLQAETTIIMIPALVFLVTLAVVGLVGNSLVILVYTRRQKWSSTAIFILILAFVDLVANVVAIPVQIYSLFYVWQYDNRDLCRAQVFSATFLTLSSGMVLLAVSIVRYRKVCQPHKWQVTPRGAKIICLVVIALGVIFSIPHSFTKGRRTKKTPRSDIVAYECMTDDEYVDTIWPLLCLAFFLLLYAVSSGCFIIMYVLIGKEAWRHRIIRGSRVLSFSVTTSTPVSWKENCETQKQFSQYMSDGSATTPDIEGSPREPVDADRTSNAQQCGHSYYSRVFADRGEVRTHNVGDFFVNLQKEKSKVSVLELHDCEISKHKSQTNEDRIQHGSSSQTEETAGDTVKKKSNGSDTPSGKGKRRIYFNAKWNWACTDNMATGHVFRGGSAEENMRFCDEVSKAEITCHSRQISEITYASSDDTVQNHLNSLTYDKQLLYKEDWIHSNTLSIFKWLDVHVSSQKSNTAGNEVNISFRRTLRQLYMRCVHSVIDYCLPLQATASPILRMRINHVQNHALRSICGGLRPSPANACEISANLEPLELRRARAVITGERFLRADKDDPCKKIISGQANTYRINKILLLEGIKNFRRYLNHKKLQRTEWQRSSITETTRRSHDSFDGVKNEVSKRPNAEIKAVNFSKDVPENDVNDETQIPVVIRSCAQNKFEKNVRISVPDVMRPSISSVITRQNWNRTTIMLIVISAIYTLGYVPSLVLLFLQIVYPETIQNMSTSGNSFYNLFLRSFFLNCAVNPIVYSLCDHNFRKECNHLFKRS